MNGILLLVSLAAGALGALGARTERPAEAPSRLRAEQPSDTLRYTARAGEPFIIGLPPRAGGADVTYRVLEAPALSWLVDRSFFWRILEGESGTLPVRFEQRAGAGAPDTLVVLVEITR